MSLIFHIFKTREKYLNAMKKNFTNKFAVYIHSKRMGFVNKNNTLRKVYKQTVNKCFLISKQKIDKTVKQNQNQTLCKTFLLLNQN